MSDAESCPRSSVWDNSWKSSMEPCNKEEPGKSSQDPGCCPVPVPGNQEWNQKRLLQEPSHHSKRTSVSDPKPSPLSSTDLGQPRKSPLTGTDKKYPLMRKRVVFSEILRPGSVDLAVSSSCLSPALTPPCGLHSSIFLSVQCQFISSLSYPTVTC